MNDNQLISLPESIGNLSSLTFLWVIKSFIDLTKWKSERLAPKYYAKKDSLALIGDDKSPLVVKWDK